MRLRWTPEAAFDLEQIATYLQVTHPDWRGRTLLRIYRHAQLLRLNPFVGRRSESEEDVRELPLTPLPYVMKYHVSEHAVTILQIRHGAQEPLH